MLLCAGRRRERRTDEWKSARFACSCHCFNRVRRGFAVLLVCSGLDAPRQATTQRSDFPSEGFALCSCLASLACSLRAWAAAASSVCCEIAVRAAANARALWLYVCLARYGSRGSGFDSGGQVHRIAVGACRRRRSRICSARRGVGTKESRRRRHKSRARKKHKARRVRNTGFEATRRQTETETREDTHKEQAHTKPTQTHTQKQAAAQSARRQDREEADT